MAQKPDGSTDLRADIRSALRAVIDPEIGQNIVDMNMVRHVAYHVDMAQIDLVLTMRGCPLASWIVERARRAACTVPGIAGAAVRVLDEPWQPPSENWRRRLPRTG